MDDMQSRETILKKDMMIVGILGLAVLNGMHFSPWYDAAFLLARPFLVNGFWITSPIIAFYLTSLMLSTLSVMIAGIPAAIFERVTGRTESDTTSLYIWLGTMVVITIPALLAAAQTTRLPG
jgi:hypothetical protein